MDKITITRDQLLAIFVQWEIDSRNGQCVPREEIEALTVEEAGARVTEVFLERLNDTIAQEAI
ncbi:hypothetical protein [Hydrogenophaga pseudoflava]|uniref:hypothetical protein n=1 Tax=Hydrogenophaga pseudoflava TaxID=47421 RepID=UPI0027E483E6|nr:hypothetical protein [Hydrogenophaga pseudoflava]MDQ7745433.1 hypothetical protein [Hydrogenophaga pseudoflava]